MKRRNTTAPLKAYQIYFFKEFAGVYVGRTPGQAKQSFVNDVDGYKPRDLYANLGCRRLRDAEWEQAAIEKYEDGNKYWRNTRAFARAQAAADAFNAKYPVGHPVKVVNCCEAKQWPGGLTTTRTPAWVMCPDRILVSVEGQAGGMYMEHIHPINPLQPC